MILTVALRCRLFSRARCALNGDGAAICISEARALPIWCRQMLKTKQLCVTDAQLLQRMEHGARLISVLLRHDPDALTVWTTEDGEVVTRVRYVEQNRL
jgi:hypothetical protein